MAPLLDRDWPRAWRGHWIGVEAPVTDRDHGPDFHVTVGGDFARQLFRRSFSLDEVPAAAPLRLTADSRYLLLVNGIEAGRGPVRSQPRRLRNDSYDIASLLQPGENTIVVLVTYYGRANSFWQPSAVNENLGNQAVLVVELDLGDHWIVSDADWQALTAPAWADASGGGIDGVPVESCDARLLDPGWRTGAGDGWGPAHLRPAGHLGALARSQPPTDPYGPLLPRPIGALGGAVATPVSALLLGTTSQPAASFPVRRVLDAQSDLAAVAATDVDPSMITIDAIAGSARGVRVDFGRVVVGLVRFGLQAPAGTVVDLLYREKPAGSDTMIMSMPKIGARYIARGQDDDFEAQEVNGFRYADLVITPTTDGTIMIEDLSVRERLYPSTGEAFFTSSDPELDRVYTAGIRTVATNASDAYTDCPTREQRAWVGDGVVHQHVHLTTSTDWRLARWYVELGNSPRPDGILPMSVVGEIEHSQQHTIADWSLNWIHGVHNLWAYDPDARAVIEAALPTARRILSWYEPYLVDGVLADVPEWNLVDWSSILLSGKSAILTALWARELRDYAELSEWVGNAADARCAEQRWESVRSGFEIFWDDGRGCYVDHVVDGSQERPASQLAGATAILAGLVASDRIERVLAWISDPDRLVTRSWIGGHGGYDPIKIGEQITGIQRIDWDPDSQVVRAEPFAAYHVHDAYRQAGRPDLIIDAVRDWSQFLVDGYDTFGECWGWGTPVHGWSSTPTKDLVTAVLGVTPAAPGFAKVRIAPAYGLLERIDGAAPTPAGLVRVTVESDTVTVDSPLPFELLLPDGSSVAGTGHWSTA